MIDIKWQWLHLNFSWKHCFLRDAFSRPSGSKLTCPLGRGAHEFPWLGLIRLACWTAESISPLGCEISGRVWLGSDSRPRRTVGTRRPQERCKRVDCLASEASRRPSAESTPGKREVENVLALVGMFALNEVHYLLSSAFLIPSIDHL